jgi:hypothetical protein
MLRSWLKALAAVIAGNLVYFLALMPHLPPAGRHHANHLDLGLAVDFWVCLAMYGLIDLFTRKFKVRAQP